MVSTAVSRESLRLPSSRSPILAAFDRLADGTFTVVNPHHAWRLTCAAPLVAVANGCFHQVGNALVSTSASTASGQASRLGSSTTVLHGAPAPGVVPALVEEQPATSTLVERAGLELTDVKAAEESDRSVGEAVDDQRRWVGADLESISAAPGRRE